MQSDPFRVIGIDPGFATGAVAVLAPSGAKVCDLPTIQTKGVNVHALAEILQESGARHAFIESVGSMPKQGVASTFSFGYGVGQVHRAVALAGIPMTLVTPGTWKKAHGLVKTKGESIAGFKERSRARALQLFLGLAHMLSRKKDGNRAEALLIARYGLSVV